MQRPIKFRAWDFESKSMQYDDIYPKDMAWPYDWEASLNVCLQLCDEAYKLMQYTGLKDKNGVEIYEGDIVRRSTGYIFEMKLDTFSLGGAGYSSAYGYSHLEDDEVIGNVYENPDLLTNKGEK